MSDYIEEDRIDGRELVELEEEGSDARLAEEVKRQIAESGDYPHDYPDHSGTGF